VCKAWHGALHSLPFGCLSLFLPHEGDNAECNWAIARKTSALHIILDIENRSYTVPTLTVANLASRVVHSVDQQVTKLLLR
jgi:hypothetical protein